MKQHIARALLVTLVLLSAAGGMLFADDTTVNLESRLVQDFSKPEAQNWFAIGSKFSTGDFPHWGFINGGPIAVIGTDPQAIKDARSLGVAMLFNRQEYNWVDIIPGTKDKPVEIPLPGRVKMLDMWVWSGNFDYYLEAYVRDYKGIVYTIPMGDLDFVGWKNLRINIPDNIPQSEKYLPEERGADLGQVPNMDQTYRGGRDSRARLRRERYRQGGKVLLLRHQGSHRYLRFAFRRRQSG